MICTRLDTALEALTASYEQVCIVGDSHVRSSFSHFGHSDEWPALWLEMGEGQKSLETVQAVWDFLFAQSMTRRGLLVCIGGGALTDLAGFASATYKRGVDWIAVPTTLLAMVDASTGGKTGFNYNGLKNSIGVFAPPIETLIWPEWLKTLPPREFLSGFAEMLKTGLVAHPAVSSRLPDHLWNSLLQYDLETMDAAALPPLIAACVAAKERIVAADPKEEGLRKVLNFGHTFGHAMEEIQIVNPQPSRLPFLHGFAVLYGMIAELYLSVTKLGCPKEPLQQLTQLMLHYYGRPECQCSDRQRLVALMQQDKKNERTAEINCTLLRDIGRPVINQVITPDEANEAWDYLFSL